MKKLISLFTVLLFILSGCLWFSTDTYADETKSSDSETAASETVPETQTSPVILPTDKVSTDDIILYSSAACVIDVDSGEILYYKNMDDRHYPASITKVLTGLLLIENANLDDTITFSQDCWNGLNYYNDMNIGILDGEQLTVNDALHAILMSSANEVCNGAAKFVSGSVSAFCDLMNERAKALGCTNTHFVNPNGLPNEEHYTSAYDLAMIGRAFFANEALCKMTMTHMLHILPSERQPDDIMEVNKMELIPGGKYAYPYLVGCKTGYTDVARSTLVSCAEKDGMKLICVVMKDENPNYYEDTIALFDYGFSNFQRANISQTETKYNIDNAGAFYSGNDIFGNSKPILQLNQNDSITLPNTITFRDAVSAISYDNTAPGQAAVITYTYNDVVLGTASIDFTASEKGSSVFGDETTGTTDGAEATAATQEPDSTGATQPTEGAAADEPADEGGGIPTATQPAASGEEDTASGGPAVIFINVIKVFFWILGIAVVIFLILLLRAFIKNYQFAHRSTRLTWRFGRRRKRSRSRYRSVNQDLQSRRREAIRQAKKRRKPKKPNRFRDLDF
mgnify:CR=1 FL=1